jgi:hypothetical protein
VTDQTAFVMNANRREVILFVVVDDEYQVIRHEVANTSGISILYLYRTQTKADGVLSIILSSRAEIHELPRTLVALPL